MIGFKCECGYSVEAEGDPSEIFECIDEHEEVCPVNEEVSPGDPTKNQSEADSEQSNTHKGVEMSDNQTTHHSTVDRAEVDRLRSVRAMIIESRDKLSESYRERLAEDTEALASAEEREAREQELTERVDQLSSQSKLIHTYNQKIAHARRYRDFAILKAAGWEETESFSDPKAVELEGPSVFDDSMLAAGYFAWTPEDGSVVMIDTSSVSDSLTFEQAHQFAYRLLMLTTWAQRELEPTIFCTDKLDRDVWETVEPMQPVFPDDSVTYRRTRPLPYDARVEIAIDPREGSHTLGSVEVTGLDDLPGIDALEAVALDLLDFVDACRGSRAAG